MVPLALVGLQEAELCRLPWWCLWKSAGLGPGRYSPLFTLLSRCPSRGLLLGKGVSAGSSVLRALGPALSHPTDKGWPFLPPPCRTKPEQLEALGTALAGGGGAGEHPLCWPLCREQLLDIPQETSIVQSRPQADPSVEPMENPAACPLHRGARWRSFPQTLLCPRQTTLTTNSDTKGFCTTDPGLWHHRGNPSSRVLDTSHAMLFSRTDLLCSEAVPSLALF